MSDIFQEKATFTSKEETDPEGNPSRKLNRDWVTYASAGPFQQKQSYMGAGEQRSLQSFATLHFALKAGSVCMWEQGENKLEKHWKFWSDIEFNF
jgi:hypothetical protein